MELELVPRHDARVAFVPSVFRHKIVQYFYSESK